MGDGKLKFHGKICFFFTMSVEFFLQGGKNNTTQKNTAIRSCLVATDIVKKTDSE